MSTSESLTQSSSSSVSESVVEFILSCGIKDLGNLTVSSIARTFDINRSYLSQRFKCDKNFSLHEYIVMVKILRSLSLLETNGNMTIDKLSKKMGFSSPDYFTRVFKKMIGTSPGKYKKFYKKLKSLENNESNGKK
ncbi:MAG: helix-turn-helix transcriptional regulator [bacterium]|nr:helix-turn-helix transcriptional regulator [bacterium]